MKIANSKFGTLLSAGSWVRVAKREHNLLIEATVGFAEKGKRQLVEKKEDI